MLLVAYDLRSVARAYVAGHLKDAADIVSYRSWEEIVGALSRYALISELTVLGHSTVGSLLFQTPTGQTEKTLTDATDYYATRANLARPQINAIHFQSCNMGLDPKPLVAFAQVFDATSIDAWNHFYVVQNHPVKVPRRATAESVWKSLADVWAYLAPDVDVNVLARRPGRHNVLLEWFRVDQNNSKLPPPSAAGELSGPREPFKRVASHTPRVVDNAADLEKLRAELRAWGFAEPDKPLYHIIVKLAGFSADRNAGP